MRVPPTKLTGCLKWAPRGSFEAFPTTFEATANDVDDDDDDDDDDGDDDESSSPKVATLLLDFRFFEDEDVACAGEFFLLLFPGKEEAETIETGSRAGSLGGYTALVAMPNTDPPQDSVAVIDFVREQGKRAGLVDVIPSGCITLGRQGETLAPMAELAQAGVNFFTDDGFGVQDASLMRRALEYARGLGVTLAQHCEVAELTKGAVMSECQCCTDLGLPGWPAIAEELMVFRDIELVRITGATMHFLHLSTARSVELVRGR
jgi:dihydroorotase-like cyclic amidohydrolase